MRARVAVLAVLFLAGSHIAQRSEILSVARAPFFNDGKTVLKAHMQAGDMYMLTITAGRWGELRPYARFPQGMPNSLRQTFTTSAPQP